MLGPGPVRDCEIEIRPAHLPRPPAPPTCAGIRRNNANTVIISEEWDTGGLAVGLQTRAANHPSVFTIKVKALMTYVSASQFHVYLRWGSRQVSIVS